MRVIAKKRCHAMFEPPEKGERATLNPNLSTRLNLLFSDQALGRRVGYCWSISRFMSTRPSKPRPLELLGSDPWYSSNTTIDRPPGWSSSDFNLPDRKLPTKFHLERDDRLANFIKSSSSGSFANEEKLGCGTIQPRLLKLANGRA